jgi:putative sugar O-methyltransferase
LELISPPGDICPEPLSSKELLSGVEAINRELEKSSVQLTSDFWEKRGQIHVNMLLRHGIGNFKRTVAHNYGNWLTIDISNYQIQRLLSLWGVHKSMECLHDVMEPMGFSGFDIKGLTEKAARDVYRLGVSLLWDYVLLTDNHGILKSLAEPVTGNPLRIMRGSRLLSQDLAHSVRERNTIVDHANGSLVIGEIGAGNGRLAHVFHLTSNCRYMIFDIAPALNVSQWYISSLFPGAKIFKFRPFDRFEDVADEVNEAQFAFFSANQLEHFPEDYFNVFINVCSLMEMSQEAVNHYISLIDRVTNGIFFTKQWYKGRVKPDAPTTGKADYRIPEGWKSLLDREDIINYKLFEQVWQI